VFALGCNVLGVELVATLLTAWRKVLVVLFLGGDGGVAVHVVGRGGCELVALLRLGSGFARAASSPASSDEAQKMKSLISICSALLLCLLSNPGMRFVVGVDYDLFHGCGHTATRCGYTRQSVFHKVSKILIEGLNSFGVGPPFQPMPNQRKQGKKKIGAWVDDAEKAQLDAELKKHGCKNLAELLRAVREGRVRIDPRVHALLLSATGASQSGCGGMLFGFIILAGLALYALT
jgi:hypothetical protein